ncbi:MAG: hypothetical protein COA70_10055 [Planctomycetota bacterium]|nr:MAG: hypothetical protein COA70_10055 [Planctomycetota bacterium]
MHVLETERLSLRRIALSDAAIILELTQDPDWIRFVGDPGLKTLADGEGFIRSRFHAAYEKTGIGLWMVEEKSTSTLLGICGLINRDSLEDVDLGFGFLKQHRRCGFAYEACLGCLEYAKDELQLTRIVAITAQGNEASGQLLEKLGFSFEKLFPFEKEEVLLRLFARQIGKIEPR